MQAMFFDIIRKRLLQDAGNYYTDNLDHYTFGKNRPLKKRIVNFFKRIFFSKPLLGVILSIKPLYRGFFLGTLMKYTKYIEPLEFFYSHLASEESKELLTKLVEFRLLGYVKVRLPLSTPEYWQGIKDLEAQENDKDVININAFPWKLHLYDVANKGFPLKVYLNAKAVYTTFVVQQYIKVDNGKKNMGPKPGNIVLDLGGCYGDTAIFFSYLVGNAGKVYSFEFIPGNINVFRKNLELNPVYKELVEIVEHPIWSESDVKTYYKDAGAGSQVSFNDFTGSEGNTTTLSVDDFVTKYNIQKVDYIKSDIEGTEPYMLKGAINTLKKFTPTLALSIYHNMGDFTGIIKQIDDLKLGYKFYLGHYTIYASETILYAVKE